MPVLKFNQCNYDCEGKSDKRGMLRVYCHRIDHKCGKLPTAPINVVVPLPSPPSPQKAIKSDSGRSRPLFPYSGPIPHLPEYVGATAKNAVVTVTKTEVEQAIKRAQKHAPGEWQAEILEIALIPQMQKYLEKQNPRYTLTRVVNGYVLHPWNSPDRPYASTAYDGFRRNFFEDPLHGLRSLIWSPKQSLNKAVVEEWLAQDKIRFHNV